MRKAKGRRGDIAKRFKKGHAGGPGRPPNILSRQLRQLTQEQFTKIASMVVQGTIAECEVLSKDKNAPLASVMVANAIIGGYKRKEFGTFNSILDRVVGKTSSAIVVSTPGVDTRKKTFEEFCEAAKYATPYPKQIEMVDFVHKNTEPRLLLGARGLGKTDYPVIMGTAYRLYCDFTHTVLLVTKSEDRNAAMIEEIRKACEANGMNFDKSTSSALRVRGHLGKDHSVATVTIGSNSIRGRHPKQIILDDPVTDEDVSEATRKRVQRVYNELHKLCTDIVVIGQPVHKADLYEMLRPLLLRMEVPHGSIPELDHDLEAQRLAGVSEESIQASYFLKVISENPSPFERVKFIDAFPSEGTAVAFIDPSHEGGDYTALTIGRSYFDGVAVKGRVWKKAWNHCLDEIIEELTRCNVQRVAFETNALGDQPVIMLRGALPTGVGVIGKKNTKQKHARIVNAGVFAEHLHIAKNSDRKYIEQVTGYEYGSKNDDAPDSLASLLEWLGLVRGV